MPTPRKESRPYHYAGKVLAAAAIWIFIFTAITITAFGIWFIWIKIIFGPMCSC